MKAGKISESVLKRSVLRQLHKGGRGILTEPGIGMDYAAIGTGARENIVFAVNPVTRDGTHPGYTGVCEALNNVACSGAEPVGVLASILVPTSFNEQQLRELMQEVEDACTSAGATVLGGHTEVTRMVDKPLVTVTGIGRTDSGGMVRNDTVRPGMDVVVTKWIALEGTAILATEREQELLQRYSAPFLRKAQEFREHMPVIREAAVASKFGASALHDVSEGGIFGALWEMAQCAGVGLEIELRKIPIRQETVEICEFFDINPYKLISGGCLLMAAEDGNRLAERISSLGIPATVIGRTTDGNDRVVVNGDERRFLETVHADELYKVLE